VYRLKKSALVIAALAVLSTAASAQTWKEGEAPVGLAASNEKDNQKKLELLKEWEQKFPDSEMKGQRSLMKAQALLGIATAAYGKTAPPELLDSAEKAGKQLTDNLDEFFSAANKPAAVSDAQWADAKKTFSLQSHVSLGWAYYAQKKDALAEDEFKKVLTIDPNQAQVSYWLGSAIIRQKDVSKYSDALYSIARSLAVTGPTALPPAAAGPAETYLKKAYSGYHGDETDLDKLKATVATGPLPPAGFHIKSVEEIEKEKFANEEEFNKAHPDIAQWRVIRTSLKSDQAETAFAGIKDALVPSEAVGMFKGTVVAVNDKDLVVNVDNAGGDGTLKFEKAINQKVINVGDKIEFKGVVESYTKDPYMLTLNIDEPKESIKGLPDNAFSAAPSTKKTPARKAAPKKK
jgi:tetratricopeptide (TPR) repeat protein